MLGRFSTLLGKVSAWLTLFMVIVTFVVVVMRYVFDVGLILATRIGGLDACRCFHGRCGLHAAA